MEQTRKQIDLSDRLSIESGLYSGESFKQFLAAFTTKLTRVSMRHGS